MSWQATAWAERQRTGSAARKALLLILANYADASGKCWPSQETLAHGTELSLDTIQRRLKDLIALGIVSIERPPKRRGQWTTLIYQLHLDVETEPQGAARSKLCGKDGKPSRSPAGGSSERPVDTEPQMRFGRAATGTSAVPQALRLKPSRELPIEPSREKTAVRSAGRLQAWQEKQERPETIQNRIAQRLGVEGWLILEQLKSGELDRLTSLERRGKLDDATLAQARFEATHARPP